MAINFTITVITLFNREQVTWLNRRMHYFKEFISLWPMWTFIEAIHMIITYLIFILPKQWVCQKTNKKSCTMCLNIYFLSMYFLVMLHKIWVMDTGSPWYHPHVPSHCIHVCYLRNILCALIHTDWQGCTLREKENSHYLGFLQE